jgi:hypothetical protein
MAHDSPALRTSRRAVRIGSNPMSDALGVKPRLTLLS